MTASTAAQLPPRDPRPIDRERAEAEATQRTAERLEARIAAFPGELAPRLELAKLYEDFGYYDEAEATLLAGRGAVKPSSSLVNALSDFYNRQGNFEKTMEYLQAAADLDPADAKAHQRVATFYWEKAFRDQRLSKEQKQAYVEAGIAAVDRAIALDGDYAEALTYKNILLRMQANELEDGDEKQRLIAEADALRDRAMELQKLQSGGLPPLPPSPEGFAAIRPMRSGMAPTKTYDVRPVYPEDARAAGIKGVVIVEATIGVTGEITAARVLRSVPMLDQAALDAVRQWRYTVTYYNGQPVPLILTVAVTFP